MERCCHGDGIKDVRCRSVKNLDDGRWGVKIFRCPVGVREWGFSSEQLDYECTFCEWTLAWKGWKWDSLGFEPIGNLLSKNRLQPHIHGMTASKNRR